MARRKAQKGTQETLTPPVQDNLPLSARSVGVAAVGAGVAATANYLFNDLPAQKEILVKLAAIQADRDEMRFALNQVLHVAQEQIDFIDAMRVLQPGLQPELDKMQQIRQLEVAKRQQRADEIARIIDKNLPKRRKRN